MPKRQQITTAEFTNETAFEGGKEFSNMGIHVIWGKITASIYLILQ